MVSWIVGHPDGIDRDLIVDFWGDRAYYQAMNERHAAPTASW